METTIEKLKILLERVDKESIAQLEEALKNVLTTEEPGVKLKVGWAVNDQGTGSNHLNLIFKID
jgi:hypothetical protein